MKNYLTVLNIITGSLFFGFDFFTGAEGRPLIILVWLLYIILILGPFLFRNSWIKALSAAAAAVTIIAAGPEPEIYLLISFQALVAAKALDLPWIIVPALFLAPVPFIPREVLHLYIFISVALSVLEILFSRFFRKSEQLRKAAEALQARNSSLIKEIDDSMINEACREQKKNRYYDGIKRLKKITENYSDKYGITFTIYQNRNILLAGRKTWNIILANCEQAFDNISAHAEAEKADIIFTRFDRILKVEITDNGRGCSLFRPGEGLTRIDKRMSGCNGVMLVKKSPSFSLIMLFPEVACVC